MLEADGGAAHMHCMCNLRILHVLALLYRGEYRTESLIRPLYVSATLTSTGDPGSPPEFFSTTCRISTESWIVPVRSTCDVAASRKASSAQATRNPACGFGASRPSPWRNALRAH
jgi:hypothetical protein